jgi:transcriptional regulator with XRE-family HTH domain
MDDIREQLGHNLKEHRERAGLSQEELAELCDLDRTEISLLERGLRFPRLDTLVRLSRGLKLDGVAQLLENIR